MLRFVIDTNIIISALLFEGSKPSKAFQRAFESGNILFSADTYAELEEVLWRQKLQSYISAEKRIRFLRVFLQQALPVDITTKITACRDPKDNKFLELAVNGKASFIITGDNDLLSLNPFQNIQIITPDHFLTTAI